MMTQIFFAFGRGTIQSIRSRELTSVIVASLVSVLLTAAALPSRAADSNTAESDADIQAPVIAPLATH